MGRKSRKQKYFSAMVALSLMAGGDVSEARDHQVISYDGYDVFDIVYVDKADQGHWVQNLFVFLDDEKRQPLNYEFSDDMKSRFNDDFLQWAEIIRPGLAKI